MSADAVAVIGFVVLFALMLLRVPVGMAMGLVGVTGFGYLVGADAGAEDGRPDLDADRDRLYVRRDPDVPADGRDRRASGMSRGAVSRGQCVCRTLARRPRHRDDRGLRAASPRSAARRSRPPRRSRPSPIRKCGASTIRKSFATGVIAAGGTLGAMFPPSIVLAVYGLITQQDIGKLFVAGILPGLLAVACTW